MTETEETWKNEHLFFRVAEWNKIKIFIQEV
jgi:hypothetical protein